MNALVKTGLPAVTGEALEQQAQTLRRYEAVPRHYGVIAMAGLVMVYDPDALRLAEAMEEGQLYVIEHQRPGGGMGWETWLQHNNQFHMRREPLMRISVEREVVRVARNRRRPDGWDYTQVGGFTERGLYEWGLQGLIIGKVVGIYAPDLAGEPGE